MNTIAISGSRHATDRDYIFSMIERTLDRFSDITHIFVGDCPTGVDKFVLEYCRENNVQNTVFKADWNKYKRGAGPRRNEEMLKHADMLLAFPGPDSKGTVNAINIAVRKGITRVVYPVEE